MLHQTQNISLWNIQRPPFHIYANLPNSFKLKNVRHRGRPEPRWRTRTYPTREAKIRTKMSFNDDTTHNWKLFSPRQCVISNAPRASISYCNSCHTPHKCVRFHRCPPCLLARTKRDWAMVLMALKDGRFAHALASCDGACENLTNASMP